MGFLRNLFFGADFKRALVEAVLADATAAVLAELGQRPEEERAVAQAAVALLVKRALERLG